MKALRRALLALGAGGLILTGAAVALILSSDHEHLRGLSAGLCALIMLSYIGTGLYAWWRRPHNRFGVLMVAVGFAFFLNSLVASDAPLLFSLGALFSGLFLVVSIHMLLAFPTGRLETRDQRQLIAGIYAIQMVASLGIMLFRPDLELGISHPRNVFLVADAPVLADVVNVGASLLGLVAVALLVAAFVRRWRASAGAARRAASPLLFTGAAMVVLLAVVLGADVLEGGAPLDDALGLATLALFAALPYAFLIGLLRSNVSRAAAVSELVERLGGGERQSLRDALADALGDRRLRLVYWLAREERYVDDAGHAVSLPDRDDRVCAATEVERQGKRIGALIHDRSLCEEPELVSAAAAAAALAMDNERLGAELRARVDELEDSRARMVQAALAERRRLERDLHDGAQQRLVALALQVNLARAKVAADPDAAGALLDGARDELRLALEGLRELARGIHPAVLTDRGLDAAIEALAARSPTPVEVVGLPAERLPVPVEAAAYFVVSESLANLAKHAGATHATVRVARENGGAVVEVRDDGRGGACLDAGTGTGLRGLADRLCFLDGRLEIESPPGGGTLVRASIPCASS